MQDGFQRQVDVPIRSHLVYYALNGDDIVLSAPLLTITLQAGVKYHFLDKRSSAIVFEYDFLWESPFSDLNVLV